MRRANGSNLTDLTDAERKFLTAEWDYRIDRSGRGYARLVPRAALDEDAKP